MAEKNGRWQLAFWVITVIATVGIVGNATYTNSVAKDSNNEDKEIRQLVYDEMKEQNQRSSDIQSDLSAIMATFGVVNRDKEERERDIR